MALLSVALGTARALLNDVAGTLWTDAALIPFAQQAQREMAARLELLGIPVVREASAVLSVPALTTNLSAVGSFPTDLVEPISLEERLVGQTDRDFIDMDERDFIPSEQQTNRLGFWAWRKEVIYLLGATVATEVRLKYTKSLALVVNSASPIGFIQGENYLGYRIAALAAGALGNYDVAKVCSEEGEKALDVVLRKNIKGMQNLPTRRRGYHVRMGNVR